MRTLLLAVLVMGCGPARLPGAPVPGQACAGDAPVCMTAGTVGTCVESKWTEWPCVDACSNSSEPRCEKVQPTKAGEACAPGSVDGGAVKCVETADGGASRAMLRCVQGKATEEACPGGCGTTLGGTAYYCNP